jgi:hypothetical protein
MITRSVPEPAKAKRVPDPVDAKETLRNAGIIEDWRRHRPIANAIVPRTAPSANLRQGLKP